MAQAKRKKRFFEVDIPILGKQTQLQAYELEELEGSSIKYDLTRMLRGKNVLLHLRVVKNNDKMEAVPKKIEIVRSALKRMVRKGTDYVEDSFSTKSKDAVITIKPFMVSRRKIHRSVRNALREKAKEELIAYLKDKESEELFNEIIKNQLQKIISLKLKKVYPLSAFEVRILDIEKKL